MELGEKLRQARLEAGLTQQALCAGEITRNMLSLIENGTARPSMKTLRHLAQRLGKPVSYFLEETAVLSANTQIMAQARSAYDRGDWQEAVRALEAFSQPDEVYGRERDLIWCLCHLALAEEAMAQGRAPYGAQLLEKADIPLDYCAPELRRRYLLLLGQLGQPVGEALPSLDEELLLRAKEALAAGDDRRAGALLDAAEHRSPRWHLLRGEIWLGQSAWQAAAQCFHQAEQAYPRETAARLEQCYRELGDFRLAYEYACKGRARDSGQMYEKQ